MLRRLSQGVSTSFRRSNSDANKSAADEQKQAPAPAAAAPAPAPAARVWRAAKDPKTGRTYYYDVLTRETQWTKPRELQDDAERGVSGA